MFKKIRWIWRFLFSCKHELYLIGTTKVEGETRQVVECEKCKIRVTTNVKGMNNLTKVYGVKVKGV